MKTKRKRRLNLLMSDREMRQTHKLAELQGKTVSDYVRGIIREKAQRAGLAAGKR